MDEKALNEPSDGKDLTVEDLKAKAATIAAAIAAAAERMVPIAGTGLPATQAIDHGEALESTDRVAQGSPVPQSGVDAEA